MLPLQVEADVIRAKGAAITCPRDGRLGAAYVDCLSSSQAGDSTLMLSYSWSYSCDDITASLLAYCHTADASFVWICCLCVNQHRVREAQAKGQVVPFEEFRETFETRITSIKNMVALLCPWRAPVYIGRVWCCESFN